MTTNCGVIKADLYAAKAPHTVNSFAFLASKGYFTDVPCHRLTTGGLNVLQCGDRPAPAAAALATQFTDENLTGATYGAGVLAMANNGSHTPTASQFFINYKDSTLPPSYTPFGKVTQGLDILQAIGSRARRRRRDAEHGAQPAGEHPVLHHHQGRRGKRAATSPAAGSRGNAVRLLGCGNISGGQLEPAAVSAYEDDVPLEPDVLLSPAGTTAVMIVYVVHVARGTVRGWRWAGLRGRCRSGLPPPIVLRKSWQRIICVAVVSALMPLDCAGDHRRDGFRPWIARPTPGCCSHWP